jgi:hypothetical protein
MYPSLLEKGNGLRRSKARFLEMPLTKNIMRNDGHPKIIT